VKQTKQNMRKMKHQIKQINQYEYEPNGPPLDTRREIIPSRVIVEGPQRNMQNMQAQLERESQFPPLRTSPLTEELDNDSSSSASSSASFTNDKISSTSSTSSASVLSKRLSKLQELHIQNVDTIKQLMSRIAEVESQLQSQSEVMQAELNQWKETHSLAEKALQRASYHHAEAIKDPPAQSDEKKDDFQQSNDLIEKLAQLTNENGQLLAKQQHQEKKEPHHKDLIVLVEDLRAENNEINELMSRMSDKLVDLKQVHEGCIQSYETQLSSLKDEINQVILSKEEMNTQLSIEHEEAHQMCEVLLQENKVAYRMCGIFQQEIDMLYEALEEESLQANASYPRTQHHPWQNSNDEEERDSTLDIF